MSVVEKSIEVDVPVRTAYDQWTMFEEFPRFMEGVEEVAQLDQTTLRWHVEIAGADRTFETKIVEQEPDKRIHWATIDGQEHEGEVRFEPAGGRTRVHLRMAYDPQNFTEKVGDAMNIIDQQVERDLERFKGFIEERDQETGAWRGRIVNGEVVDDGSSAAGGPASPATDVATEGPEGTLSPADPSAMTGETPGDTGERR